jgi:hypothetical protein
MKLKTPPQAGTSSAIFDRQRASCVLRTPFYGTSTPKEASLVKSVTPTHPTLPFPANHPSAGHLLALFEVERNA